MRRFLSFMKAFVAVLIFFSSMALVISVDIQNKRQKEQQLLESIDVKLSQTQFEFGEGDATIKIIDLVLNQDDFEEIDCLPRVIGNRNPGIHKVMFKVKYRSGNVIREKSIEKEISVLDTLGPTIHVRENVTGANKEVLRTLVAEVNDPSDGIISYRETYDENARSFWTYIPQGTDKIKVIAVDRYGNKSEVLVQVPESMRHLLDSNYTPTEEPTTTSDPIVEADESSCYLSTTDVSYDGNTYKNRDDAIAAGTEYVQMYQTQTNPPTGVALTSVYKICSGKEDQLEYYIWDLSW